MSIRIGGGSGAGKHRRRLEAFLSSEPGAKDNAEILKLLLSFVMSEATAGRAARILLERFGSFGGVLKAGRESLASVDGVGSKAAELISELSRSEDLLGGVMECGSDRIFSSYPAAGKYLSEYFKDSTGYEVIMLLLDNGMRVIDVISLYDVDYAYAAIKPRRVIDCALNSHASAVVTAHCHPYGPLFPSEGDRSTNEMVTGALQSVGVVHLEHFLVCGSEFIGIMDNQKDCFATDSGIYTFLKSKEENLDPELALHGLMSVGGEPDE